MIKNVEIAATATDAEGRMTTTLLVVAVISDVYAIDYQGVY
jgi:hypothetical protein